MDAKPFLVEIGRLLQDLNLEAVLIGNAAAALQGAPVTTVDFDFFWSLHSRMSSRARKPRGGRETWPFWKSWREPLKKPSGRKAKLAAVGRESERDLRDLIRRWQALPPQRRTNFLRKRLAFRRTVL